MDGFRRLEDEFDKLGSLKGFREAVLCPGLI